MSYKSEHIFQDDRINSLIDYMFDKIIEAFPPPLESEEGNDHVLAHVVLSGRCAGIMQGEDPQDTKNIMFETDKPEFYLWCAKNLGRIFDCQLIAYKERLLFYPRGYFFELWYTDEDNLYAIKTEDSEIFVQHIDNIPEQTL